MLKEKKYSTAFNNMFREYDIRGKVNSDELNHKNVYRIVKAYAIYLAKRNIRKAVVGYDNRACSPDFANQAIKALREAGIDVVFIGLTLTPVVYYAQYYFKCEGAVMITASHNPNGWSGFKFAKGYSKTLEPDDIFEVKSYIDSRLKKPEKVGNFEQINVHDEYVAQILRKIKMGKKKIKVVTESANGGAGLFVNEVLEKLGCETFQLNADPDVSYPKYFPNPSEISSRQTLIKMTTDPYVKADLGVFIDGDGDRIGVVDDKGRNIYSDIILAVLAKQLLEKKRGATVIYDVKCSKALEEVIKKYGGNPVMCKTGHSYVKAKMHELSAELAGERSGHIFIGGKAYYSFDDAIFVTAKLVEYLSSKRKPLSEIIDEFPKYVTSSEIRAHCADELKYDVMEKIVEDAKKQFPGRVNDINGARIEFDDGWGLIRASSNLPELVIIVESKTKDGEMRIKKIIKKILSKYSEVSRDWENDIE